MLDRKPLKVKIILNPDGTNKHPPFEGLTVVQNTGMHWTRFIDIHCGGWLYQNSSSILDDLESPFGVTYGLLLADSEFAEQAALSFPNECSILTDLEAKAFYEGSISANQPTEIIDEDVIKAVQTRIDLGITLEQEHIDAIDPTNPAMGIRKNPYKKWDDMKTNKGITIVPAQVG